MDHSPAERALTVAIASVADALSELCFALNMPVSEQRNMKIGTAVEEIDRATARIRANVLMQGTTKQ